MDTIARPPLTRRQRLARSLVRMAVRGLVGLVGLVVLLSLVGLLLPSEVQFVDTSSTLQLSRSDLFPYFNSRAGQQRMWTEAWRRSGGTEFPPMKIADLGGPDSGVGTGLGFFPDGRRLGSIAGLLALVARGRGVIVESEPLERVVIEIDFGMVAARRTIDLEAVDDNTTKVSWSETLLIANPLMRYLPLLAGGSANEGFRGVLAAAEGVARADRERDP